MNKGKQSAIYQENLKVLFEVSRKVRDGDFDSFDEVTKFVWSHPNYTPTNHDLSYGIAHLNNLKFYFQ